MTHPNELYDGAIGIDEEAIEVLTTSAISRLEGRFSRQFPKTSSKHYEKTVTVTKPYSLN